ncbi:MAG: hypothetical protein E7I97_08485, partial [Lactococcus lactis]|nr:hypothetical protein [Lactococcus lactis]
ANVITLSEQALYKIALLVGVVNDEMLISNLLKEMRSVKNIKKHQKTSKNIKRYWKPEMSHFLLT